MPPWISHALAQAVLPLHVSSQREPCLARRLHMLRIGVALLVVISLPVVDLTVAPDRFDAFYQPGEAVIWNITTKDSGAGARASVLARDPELQENLVGISEEIDTHAGSLPA